MRNRANRCHLFLVVSGTELICYLRRIFTKILQEFLNHLCVIAYQCFQYMDVNR